ncbi:hypothetical protein FRC14_003192 [Serendipita sp. 396]|nr:hypothetical protein FRC14_003192 [Serendipita sp. 396]
MSDNNSVSEVQVPKRLENNGTKTFCRNLDAVTPPPTVLDVVIAARDAKEGVGALEDVAVKPRKSRIKVFKPEEIQEKLKRDIHVNRASSFNLCTVPDDILSVIFEFYVDELSPWTLMWVCRQWRAAAIQTRRIWSKILLTKTPRRADDWNDRWQGGEVCYSLPTLQNALKRAGGAPLDISISTPHSTTNAPLDPLSSQLIDLLRVEGAYHRIQTFDTKYCSLEWSKTAKFEGFEFPALQEAYLSSGAFDVNKCILKTASRLRSLSIFKLIPDEFDWDLSSMHNLEELSIYIHYFPPCGPELIQLIDSVPRLTTLHLNHVSIPGFQGSTSLSIPSLLVLVLSRTGIRCRMDLPNLVTLSVKISTIASSEADPLVLPCLQYLNVDYFTVEQDLYIHASALETLALTLSSCHPKLDPSSSMEKLLKNAILPGQMSPCSFVLSAPIVNAQLLSDVLTYMPQLKNWEFDGMIASSKSFFDKFAGRSLGGKSSHATKKVPLCPSLEYVRIRVETPSDSKDTSSEEAMVKWYKKTIQVRKTGQHAIKTALIWDKVSEMYVSL